METSNPGSNSDSQSVAPQNPVSTPPAYTRSKLQITVTLSALFLSLFLAALDFTIATTAVPSIVTTFHSAAGYTWIGSAYQLASAASTPIWGKLSDIWGRKVIFLAAIVTFAVGSVICASAATIEALLVGRSIQGAAAGGIVILVNICISDLFSMRDRGFYLGLTGIVWGFASGVGPLIGGAFSQYVSWRWNWWINLPCSGVAFIALALYLDVHSPRTTFLNGIKAVDWIGTMAIVGMSLMVLLGLNLGGVFSPWNSVKVICLLVFGSFTGVLFAVYEAKYAPNPLMPVHVLRKLSNNASLLVCFAHGFVNSSSWFFLPLYFQSSRGLDPLHAGLLLMPITVIQAFVACSAGTFIHRTGHYMPLIYIGMALTTLGFSLFTLLSATSSTATITGIEIVAGLGIGLVFQPPLIALQSLVPHDDVATATALFGFTRSLSTSVSIVIGGAVFQNAMQSHHASLRAELPADMADKFSGNEAMANVDAITTLSEARGAVVKDAYAQSLSRMWILYACVAGFGLLASFGIRKQTLSRQHVETRTGIRTGGK